MATESTLLRIGGLHVALVAVSAVILADRSSGVLLGGAAIGGATLASWAIARGLSSGISRIWLVAIGVLKVSAYLLLVTAGLAGAVSVDPIGFGAGVTCFPIAVVAGALQTSARWRTAD